jgi:SAM-dependent methyltransferase
MRSLEDRTTNLDEQNITLGKSTGAVEELLSTFYRRFPYPWKPLRFYSPAQADFESMMFNQSIGDFHHNRLDRSPKIWVGGCGTNQALMTALRFPRADVLGSDLSSKSLEICAANARETGVTNLRLKEESLNQVAYEGQFDYIICTGVIHHNADPRLPLTRLASALKPKGVLELMVYNRFHRLTTSVFQKAVRMLCNSGPSPDFDLELKVAKKILDGPPIKNALLNSLGARRGQEEASFADGLIHPLEHSYTVQTLNELVESCGLELMTPCMNIHDAARNRYLWHIAFDDPELEALYYSLPDVERWQVCNLLLFEESPMLWFYVQRKDSGCERKSELEVCEEFLNTKFEKVSTTQKVFTLDGENCYKLSEESAACPASSPDPLVKEVYEAVDPGMVMADVLDRVGIRPEFQTVNLIRILLTTSIFPYLKATSAPEGRGAKITLRPNRKTIAGDSQSHITQDEMQRAMEEATFEGEDSDE